MRALDDPFSASSVSTQDVRMPKNFSSRMEESILIYFVNPAGTSTHSKVV
jgi:hypothetical protein